MSITIDLPSEIESLLREEASRQGRQPAEYIGELVKRELVIRELHALRSRTSPQSLADLKPARPSPPGKSWLDSVLGQWPGDESDAEIDQVLREVS